MPIFVLKAEIARPCEVLIVAPTAELALARARAGDYDEIVNEQGGAGCEEVRILPAGPADLEEWDEDDA